MDGLPYIGGGSPLAKSSGAKIDPLTGRTTTTQSTGTYARCPAGQVVMKTIRGKFGARDRYVCGIPAAPKPVYRPPPPPPKPANISVKTNVTPTFQQSFTPQVSPNIQVSTGSGSQSAGTRQSVAEKQANASTPTFDSANNVVPIRPIDTAPIINPEPAQEQVPLYSGGGGFGTQYISDLPQATEPAQLPESEKQSDKIINILGNKKVLISAGIIIALIGGYFIYTSNNEKVKK